MLEKNQRLELRVESMSSDGKGIARTDGYVIFINGGLTGERVEAHIILVKKSFAVAKIVRIIEASPHRIQPPCSVYPRCGGCQIMHQSYAAQLDFKQAQVSEAFSRLAKIDAETLPVFPSPLQFNYRNKLSLPIRQDADGGILTGFFQENSHRIVPHDHCLLQKENMQKIVKSVTEFLRDFKISIYNEDTQKGLVRHLVARDISDSTVISLVVNGVVLPHSKALGERLENLMPNNAAFYANFNTKNNNVIMGDKYEFISGKKDLKIDFLGLRFRLHPASFFQVNEGVAAALYEDAIRLAALAEPDLVIDAYCGAGALSCILSRRLNCQVLGVDIVKEAIDDAKSCARENAIESIEFLVGDCAEVVPKLMRERTHKRTLVLLDPPRKGCDRRVLDSLLSALPYQILYISCDPATLARDLKILNEKYTVTYCKPYDMFPQTTNVETLVRMELR